MVLSSSAQEVVREMFHDGEVRTYRVYLPDGFTGESGLPVVINMHGFGSNAIEQRIYTRFNLEADRNNFIVVYPQGTVATIPIGTGNHWNAGFNTGVDDIGFIDKVIDRLWNEFDIDLSRVYATGMSNGGFMAYTLACELSHRIAAVASVTGSMTVLQQTSCNPGYAVPVLQFHGTADPVVDYEGTEVYPGIPELMDFWAEIHGCQTITTETDLEDERTDDESTVTLITYQECDDVILYRINDGGHTWPDAVLELDEAGPTNRDVNATSLIWTFLSMYEHPDPAPAAITATEELPRRGRIFPTLFDSHLVLRDLEGVQVTLMDRTGRVWKEEVIRSSLLTWEMSELASGLYLIRLEYPNQEPETLKVIKL